MLLGAGRSSILKLTTSASSGYLVRTSTGLNHITIANLTIDGNTATGSGQDGVQIRDVDGVSIHNTYFKNFSGEHLVLTHSGSQGNPCTDVMISQCHFEGGSGDQLLMDDVQRVVISGCVFENPTTKCINGTPSNSSSYMDRVTVMGCSFDQAANSIYIVGGGGTADNKWRLVDIINNVVLTDSGVGITCGAASAILKWSRVCNNSIQGVTGDAINCEISSGVVSGNFAPSAGGDGIDALSSANVLISGNYLPSATTIGIDGTGTTSCSFCDNDVTGSTTPLSLAGATTPFVRNNLGIGIGHIIGGFIEYTGDTRTTDGSFATTFTIPAMTLARAGDGFQLQFHVSTTGGSDTGITFTAYLNDGGSDQNIAAIAGVDINDVGHGWGIGQLILGPSTASNLQCNYGGAVNDDNVFNASGTRTIDWTADVTLGFGVSGLSTSTAKLEAVSLVFIGDHA